VAITCYIRQKFGELWSINLLVDDIQLLKTCSMYFRKFSGGMLST